MSPLVPDQAIAVGVGPSSSSSSPSSLSVTAEAMDSFPFTIFDDCINVGVTNGGSASIVGVDAQDVGDASEAAASPPSTPPPPAAPPTTPYSPPVEESHRVEPSPQSACKRLRPSASDAIDDGPPIKRATIDPSHSASSFPSPAAVARQRKRLVRFHPSSDPSASVTDAFSFVAAAVPRASDLTDSERSELWWSPGDYDLFRESAKAVGRKLRERVGLTRVLERAFDYAGACAAAKKGAGTGMPTRREEEEEESGETKEEFADADVATASLLARGLAKWSAHGHACRGLEKYGSADQLRRRTAEAKSAVRAVLVEQEVERMRREWSEMQPGRHGVEGKEDEEDRDGATAEKKVYDAAAAAETLRRTSRRATARTRHFAKMMGDADAAAVLVAADVVSVSPRPQR